jgi:hypothetical protein
MTAMVILIAMILTAQKIPHVQDQAACRRTRYVQRMQTVVTKSAQAEYADNAVLSLMDLPSIDI